LHVSTQYFNPNKQITFQWQTYISMNLLIISVPLIHWLCELLVFSHFHYRCYSYILLKLKIISDKEDEEKDSIFDRRWKFARIVYNFK
jgi:hypothetical protein